MCSKLSFDDWFSLEIDRLKITSEDEHTLLSRYLRNRSSFEDFKFKNQKFVGWKDDMCFPVDVSCSEFHKYLRFLNKNLNETRYLNILWTKQKYYVDDVKYCHYPYPKSL